MTENNVNQIKDSETPAAIQYPKDGIRGVQVPLEELIIDGASGLLRSRTTGSDFSEYLTSAINNNGKFEKIRSAVIIHDVDILVKNWDVEETGYQAGFTVLKGKEPTESFVLDLTVDKDMAGETLTPETGHVQVLLFNTPYPQVGVENLRMRASKKLPADGDPDLNVDSDTYQTAMVIPGGAYNQERFKVKNTGTNANDLDARISTLDAGETTPEKETLALSDGKWTAFNNLPSAEAYLLELKETSAGNPTTAKTVFRGEAE